MFSRRSDLEDESNKEAEEEDEESIDSPFYRAIFKVNKKKFCDYKSFDSCYREKTSTNHYYLENIAETFGKEFAHEFPKKVA